MIDLNNDNFLPSYDFFRKEVLSVPQELIYYKYLGDSLNIGGVTLSPFRQDLRPSFGVYYEDGVLLFNDFGSPDSGTVVDFVYKYYREVLKITTTTEFLSRFRSDFYNIQAESNLISPASIKNFKKAHFNRNTKEFKLEVKIRPFTNVDLNYWSNFGIRKSTLQLFNVFPIAHYFINGKGFKADSIAYVYIETKDDVLSFKIYQPLNKSFKWISNTNFSVHQGYRQLPAKGSLMIITKSLKDVMSIRDVTGIPAIGVQGEKSRIKDTVLAEYLDRFTEVICLFDNDSAGIELSEFYEKYYKLPYMLLPKDENIRVKDFSNMVMYLGHNRSREILKELLMKNITTNIIF